MSDTVESHTPSQHLNDCPPWGREGEAFFVRHRNCEWGPEASGGLILSFLKLVIGAEAELRDEDHHSQVQRGQKSAALAGERKKRSEDSRHFRGSHI